MMSRVPDLSDDDLSPEQRAVVAEAVAGLRGRMPAPMRAWLVSPELARRAQHLGEFLRYQTSLEPRLSELAILVTARFWTSHYEWYAHVDAAPGRTPTSRHRMRKSSTPSPPPCTTTMW
jgi:4-carboxymuconolactone decarboxylase